MYTLSAQDGDQQRDSADTVAAVGYAYDTIALLYDTEYEQVTGDIEMYKSIAAQTTGAILELACGSGRVLAALAGEGHTPLVGLDLSQPMLDLAKTRIRKRRVSAANMDAGEIHLVQADMRRFDMPTLLPGVASGGFGLIFIAINSFLHLPTPEDQIACLSTVRRHLAPGGTFVIDVFNPEMKDSFPSDGRLELLGSFTNPATGNRVLRFSSTTEDRTTQSRSYLHIYDEMLPDKNITRLIAEFSLRYIYRYEMALLLDKAGLGVEALYGSHDFDDYAGNSDHMIFVCKAKY